MKAKLSLLAAMVATAAPAAATPPPHEFLLNQLGFLPDGAKHAILPSSAPAPMEWRVVDEQGRVKLTGRTSI